MTSCRLSLCLLAVAGLPGTVLTVSTTQQNIMDDIVGVWGQYRDPLNGFWCDTLRFTSGTPVDILCNSRVSREMLRNESINQRGVNTEVHPTEEVGL